MTHHRGAYLNAVSNILAANLGPHPVYLWTLPMFHCNGWCIPWTIAASAGINVCLRKVDPTRIFELIKEHGVTHMAGAPIVYNTLINDYKKSLDTMHRRRVSVGLQGHRNIGATASAKPVGQYKTASQNYFPEILSHD